MLHLRFDRRIKLIQQIATELNFKEPTFLYILYKVHAIVKSFVSCSMHKNPHQNAGNGIKDTFQNFSGEHASGPPLRFSTRAFGASRANSCLPPQNF